MILSSMKTENWFYKNIMANLICHKCSVKIFIVNPYNSRTQYQLVHYSYAHRQSHSYGVV